MAKLFGLGSKGTGVAKATQFSVVLKGALKLTIFGHVKAIPFKPAPFVCHVKNSVKISF